MLLSEQPMHGYEIIQQIGDRSGGAWHPSPGSVYPALQMLEDQQLIQAEEAEGRRTYNLTDAGRDHVDQHREELAAVWASVQGAATDVTRELRDLMDQVGMATGQVARVGAPAQLAAARDLLTATRQQLYRILADDADTGGDEAR
jgi:DNA-binding PadR family transcriptional regulator